MDPWADSGGAEAGPSWSPKEEKRAPSPPRSPTGLRADLPSTDPWATDGGARDDSVKLAEASYTTPRRPAPQHLGSQDFDPWGGGSVALPPVHSQDASRLAYAKDREQTGVHEDGEWSVQQSNEDGDIPAFDASQTPGDSDRNGETIPAGDDDDPWGSGARAVRLREEEKAEAMARQMEIVRIQEETRGEYKGSKEDEAGQAEESLNAESASTEGKQKASASLGGWRSLFSRTAAAKTPEPTAGQKEEGTQEEAKSPSSATNPTAPRLWQAPSLADHARTSSSSSQSKAEQSTADKSSGPGWSMAPKKPAQPSGGFMSSILGGGQRPSIEAGQESSSSLDDAKRTAQGKLDQIRQSLRPPETVSAADDEDEGDTEDTSIEWEKSPTKSTAAERGTDLLGAEVEQTPQASAVGRFFGRWRGGSKEQTASAKTKESQGMSNDDLSWLENVGGTSSSNPTASQGPRDAAASSSRNESEEEDWLAFVQGSQPQSKISQASSQTSSDVLRPAGAYRDTVVSYDENEVASTAGRRSTSQSQSNRYFYDEHADYSSSHDRKDSFSAFTDAPAYRDSPQPRLNATSGAFSSSSLRPTSAALPGRSVGSVSLSPSNSLKKQSSALGSPPSSSRPGSAASGSGRLPPPPPASRHIVGHHVLHRTGASSQQPQHDPTSLANNSPPAPQSMAASPSASQAAPLVAPPQQQQLQRIRAPALQSQQATLSKGSTLTQDDLSFFENL